MTLIYDSEKFTPSNPVAHIAREQGIEGNIVLKNDSYVQVFGFTGEGGVNLDLTSNDLNGFERVKTVVSFTPDEARKIAVELMTAAALAEAKLN